MIKISDFFSISETVKATHSWTHNNQKPHKNKQAELVFVIADEIIRNRCIKAAHLYEAWRNKRDKGVALDANSEEALLAFIKPIFGTIKKPHPHSAAFISEFCFYLFLIENPKEEIRFIKRPSFQPTDHGADGFVIHQTGNGTLMFRLWEIKKKKEILEGIREGSKQLKTKGIEYLARILATEQEFSDEKISKFLSQLIDHWQNHTEQAAAGVCVSTAEIVTNDDCFDSFRDDFTEYHQPRRLRGMITSIDDFDEFTDLVRKEIWKGL